MSFYRGIVRRALTEGLPEANADRSTGRIGQNSILGALAHLGLARALAASGDSAGARTAYQDFLTLWKDADPDIPLLKQAKAEYAKLQ